MVFISKIPFFASKPKKVPRKYTRSGFMDSLRLHVKAGAGGNGLPKFGGVGGQGGNIYAIAKESLTLDQVLKGRKSRMIIASHGRSSSHNFILGTPGEHVELNVPVGVTVFTELGKKLGELNKEGDRVLIAKGGTGGHAKNGFLGTKGQEYPIKLDLKLIADIGLVGFPNAGKSTLLKAVSHANPKIASYPFTTIRPNVGTLMYKDFRQISMADLPGLIEGAHANKGMGHQFLKHVERTKLLLLVVDINGFQLSPQHTPRSCLDNIVLLNKELELYNADLINKPSMIIINKMDTEGTRERFKEIRDKIRNLSDSIKDYPEEMRPEKALKFDNIMAISAKESNEDIELVKDRLRNILDVNDELNRQKELENANLMGDLEGKLQERGPRLV